MRKTALPILAKRNPVQAASYLFRMLESEFISDRQYALANLGTLSAPGVDIVLLVWLEAKIRLG